jgi:hypothetical protein
MSVDKEKLRSAINRSLRKQGYKFRDGTIHVPSDLTKDDYRKMQDLAVKQKLVIAKPNMKRLEDRLLN